MSIRTIRTTTLGAVVSRFGIAGGPEEVVLSERNAANAFALGASVPVGSPSVPALLALAAAGGEALLSTRVGSRLTITDFGRIYARTHAALGCYGLGYVEQDGETVRLTATGREAVARGRAHQESLLARARVDARTV